MPDTTMKQYKWMPVSQLLKSKNPDAKKQRRLFGAEGDDNSRTSLGMDEGGSSMLLTALHQPLSSSVQCTVLLSTDVNCLADSNMSNLSTASDSLDGPPTMTELTKPDSSPGAEAGQKRMTVAGEGGRYTGEFGDGGQRQGRGEYVWPNGDRSCPALHPTSL